MSALDQGQSAVYRLTPDPKCDAIVTLADEEVRREEARYLRASGERRHSDGR
jgi:hypothetical protein